jgi:pilus assembly protein CpaB
MNPRQRRGVLLLGLGFVGAVIVFVVIAGYVADVRKNVKPTTEVFVLKRDVQAQESIASSLLARKEVPEKYVSKTAITDLTAIGNRVAGQHLPKGAELQEGMLIDPPRITPGQREISVLISADTGVAGKIQPGDTVDIEATFPAEGQGQSIARARTIISRAQIVTIGTPQTGAGRQNFGTDQGRSPNRSADTVVPVTFALSPRQVLVLTYAEQYADGIRLALIAPGDSSRVKNSDRDYTLPPTTRRAP